MTYGLFGTPRANRHRRNIGSFGLYGFPRNERERKRESGDGPVVPVVIGYTVANESMAPNVPGNYFDIEDTLNGHPIYQFAANEYTMLYFDDGVDAQWVIVEGLTTTQPSGTGDPTVVLLGPLSGQPDLELWTEPGQPGVEVHVTAIVV